MFNTRSRPLHPRERDPVPIVQEEGWDPRPVWTSTENLVPTGTRSTDGAARSESLHQLSYPGLHVSVTFSLWQSSQLHSGRAYEPGHQRNVVESTAISSTLLIVLNNETIILLKYVPGAATRLKYVSPKIFAEVFLPTDLHKPRYPTLRISYRHNDTGRR